MTRTRSLRSPALVSSLLTLLALAACKPKDPPPDPDARNASASVSNVPEVVPPAAPFNATPVAKFADAGNIDGLPPFEQATIYEGNGQLWMARLVLEPKAFGSDGTNKE